MDGNVIYDIVGLAYFGQSHFVAHFIDKHSMLWFHNGIANGGSFINEGYAEDHPLPSLMQCHDKRLVALLYVKRDGGQWQF